MKREKEGEDFLNGEREREREAKTRTKTRAGCQRSIFCLGSLPLCMRNSKAEVFLNSFPRLWEYSAGPCGYTDLHILLLRWLTLHFGVFRAGPKREILFKGLMR